MYYDSTGKPVKEGDRVRCRGREYTIKAFRPGEGRNGVAAIDFTSPFHTAEVPDEISIDLIEEGNTNG